MPNVVEFHTDKLTKLTKKLWEQHSTIQSYDNGTSYIDGVKVADDILQEALCEVPWVSGTVGFIIIEPHHECPIHLDIHEENNFNKSLNILLESDLDNHATSYYEYVGKDKVNSIYDGKPEDLKKVFEFTVKHPTLFHNQVYHNVNNYGSKRRVMALWLIDNKVTDDYILEWASASNIRSEVLF